MELKWLEDFLSLSKSGNFRISSEQRIVSQPAFSRRIRALENWVGGELIDRTSHPVHLTEAGRLFKPQAQELVQLIYQTRTDINNQNKDNAVKICFSTHSTLAQFFIPSWLKELKPFIDTEHFNVRTDFGSIEDYLSALTDGSVDFFICYEDPCNSILKDQQDAFASIHLGNETLVAVVTPDINGKPSWWLPAKHTNAIPYLHTDATLSVWPIKQHQKIRYPDLTFAPVYQSSIATSLKAMVIEGYGVAWIPHSIVADDLASGRLMRAAEEDDDIPINIKIFRDAACVEPRIEKFWQALL